MTSWHLMAAVAVGCVALAAADGPPATTDAANASSRAARDFAGYAPSPSSYDTYDPSTASSGYLNPDKWSQPGLVLPNLSLGCGSGASSLVRPILAGVLGALLLKLPLLLAAKLLILKLVVPFGLLAAASPVLLPLAYMLFNKKPGSSSSSNQQNDTGADSRALHDFLTSSACLERIACTIGRSQARSDSVKTFSWMLKSVEGMLSSQNEMRSLVGSYRSAYLNGAGRTTPDGCASYQCSIPELFVRQGGTSYRLL